VNTPKEQARREMRRELNEEVYPVLEELAQALDRLPEDAPTRPGLEVTFSEILAKVRIAETALAGVELDDDDMRMLPPKPDDDD
jgi:hypothetical protein